MTAVKDKEIITTDYANDKEMEKLKEKSLLPTNDVIFHCLFGEVGNEKITKSFLEEILNMNVGEIDLDLNLNLTREYYDSKLGVLDVRAKAPNGVNYNIEMQNTSSEKLPERILSYWSRLYTMNLKRGNNYNVLTKTIAVIIVNDNVKKFELLKKYHTRWNIREEDYKDMILTDDFEIHIVELPKYIQMRKNKKCKNIWLEFLLEPEGKEVLEAMKECKEVGEARKKWRKITSDEIIRDRALRLEIAELDRNTDLYYARKSGLEEGIEKQNIAIAKKMLEQNLDMDIIVKTTGLSEEKVLELKEGIN